MQWQWRWISSRRKLRRFRGPGGENKTREKQILTNKEVIIINSHFFMSVGATLKNEWEQFSLTMYSNVLGLNTWNFPDLSFLPGIY